MSKSPLSMLVARVHARNPELSRSFIRQVAQSLGETATDSDVLDACEAHLQEMAELG